jgi:hypothetical protein
LGNVSFGNIPPTSETQNQKPPPVKQNLAFSFADGGQTRGYTRGMSNISNVSNISAVSMMGPKDNDTSINNGVNTSINNSMLNETSNFGSIKRQVGLDMSASNASFGQGGFLSTLNLQPEQAESVVENSDRHIHLSMGSGGLPKRGSMTSPPFKNTYSSLQFNGNNDSRTSYVEDSPPVSNQEGFNIFENFNILPDVREYFEMEKMNKFSILFVSHFTQVQALPKTMNLMKNFSIAADIYTCVLDENNAEINEPYMKIFFLQLPLIFIEINRQKFVEVPLIYDQDYILNMLERILIKKNENSLLLSPNRQFPGENVNMDQGQILLKSASSEDDMVYDNMIAEMEKYLLSSVKEGRRSEEEFLVFQLLSREKYDELYALRKIYRTNNGKNVMVQKITFFLSENNIERRKEVFLGNAKASMVWIFGNLSKYVNIDVVAKNNFAQIIDFGNWERLVDPF